MNSELIETSAPTGNEAVTEAMNRRYSAGFVTDIESESLPLGLNEDIVRAISARKNEPEWMTEWRLKAYRHWLTMKEPHWAKLKIDPIDFQAISYYSQPKNRPKSLDEVDPKLLETYDKLARASPVSPSMRCSIPFPSERHSAKNSPKPA